MPLTREKLHSMGKDSEAGEKFENKGEGEWCNREEETVCDQRQEDKPENLFVPGAGKGEECHEKCREAGRDVRYFVFFPPKQQGHLQ